ncbi:MAG: hypothetical protein F4201_01015 [Nitrospira sp. SB0677_bin_15]|nr:hypothetical protein [Nitrospira sp. SB0667_bin_9]MYG39404.1 hypothetical protein [Nitrospira sp. SB0677_bin_15]
MLVHGAGAGEARRATPVPLAGTPSPARPSCPARTCPRSTGYGHLVKSAERIGSLIAEVMAGHATHQ